MQVVLLGGAVAGWAVVHSWLASTRMKTYVAASLGTGASRAYRLIYNVFSFISLAPIAWLLWTLPDRQLYAVPTPWGTLMWAIQAGAAGLAVITLLQTDAMHFAGIPQVLGRSASGALVQSGMYGVVRHPLYLFGLILLWCSPRMSANQLTVTIAFTLYLFVGALIEERRLVAEFGEAYTAYRSRTPMIIPRVRR